jgi:hypothetical protein
MGAMSGGCPKCGGLLQAGKYLGEGYEDCVQCGYVRFLEQHSAESDRRHLSEDKESMVTLGDVAGKSRHRSVDGNGQRWGKRKGWTSLPTL